MVRGVLGTSAYSVRVCFQELDRAAQLVETVHPVLDGYPAGEVDRAEDAEDLVVVVAARAGLTMLQLVGIADGAFRRQDLFERRPRREKSVRGVHRDDAMLDLVAGRRRIEAANQGVRRIVLHTEVRRVGHGVEQRQKRRLLLREFRVEPLADLVVVLEAEDHVAFLRVLERARDARRRRGRRPRSSERPGYFWPLSVRQCRAPVRIVRSIASFCRSTSRSRSSRSGCVKSGEKHIIEEICPVSSIASMTGATSRSS